jgi:TPR repeat protein
MQRYATSARGRSAGERPTIAAAPVAPCCHAAFKTGSEIDFTDCADGRGSCPICVAPTSTGKGVKQDYAKAVKWYRLAAAQGYAEAQTNLGVMYYTGRAVVQDYIRADIWFNLGGTSGNAHRVRDRDLLAAK